MAKEINKILKQVRGGTANLHLLVQLLDLQALILWNFASNLMPEHKIILKISVVITVFKDNSFEFVIKNPCCSSTHGSNKAKKGLGNQIEKSSYSNGISQGYS